MSAPASILHSLFAPYTFHVELSRNINGVSRKNDSIEIWGVCGSFEERRSTPNTDKMRIVEGILVILFSDQFGELG